MPSNISFSSSGWSSPVSERAASEIKTHFSEDVLEAVAYLRGKYVSDVQTYRSTPEPAQFRARLERFSTVLDEFYGELRSFREVDKNYGKFIARGGAKSGDPNALDEIWKSYPAAVALRDHNIPNVIAVTGSGRRMEPERNLVLILAAELESMGETINASPKGMLVQIAGIILEDAVDEAWGNELTESEKRAKFEPSKVREITRRALEWREQTKKDLNTP